MSSLKKLYVSIFVLKIWGAGAVFANILGEMVVQVRSYKKWTLHITKALFSKSAHEGVRESKYPKICPRGLWMAS